MSSRPPVSHELDALVASSAELYTLPGVAVRVLELTRDPQVDTAALKACLENDPALAGKILRVVNSSLFGLSRKVSDLNQALALLGVKPLKLLVLGFCLPDRLFRDVSGDLLTRYWQRSLTRAVAARELAERLWQVPGDEAQLAGLLKDLGQLVLIKELGNRYTEFVRLVALEGVSLPAAERHLLGFDHIELTARLLDTWGLPAELVQAIVPAETADGASPSAARLHAIVELAELVADLLVERQYGRLPEVLQSSLPPRQLATEEFEQLVSALERKVSQLVEVLSIELTDVLAYRDILAEAHRQLVAVATDSAGEIVQCRRESLQARLDHLQLLDEVRQLNEEVERYKANVRRQPLAAPAPAGTVAAASTGFAKPSQGLPPAPARSPRRMQRAAESAKPTTWLGLGSAAPRAAEAEALDSWDPALLGRISMAVAACRQARCPLSLMLVELDRYGDLAFARGPQGAQELFARLRHACQQLDHPLVTVLPVAEARLAVLLPGCERRRAIELGHELLRAEARSSEPDPSLAASLSIGLASIPLPPRNFPPTELLESAGRCLYAACVSGGNSLKSIEL